MDNGSTGIDGNIWYGRKQDGKEKLPMALTTLEQYHGKKFTSFLRPTHIQANHYFDFYNYIPEVYPTLHLQNGERCRLGLCLGKGGEDEEANGTCQ